MIRIPTDTKELKNETLSWREKEIIHQHCKLSQDSTDASVLKMLHTSSATSRRAAVAKSSSGSTPPLGTTHLSGTFELETSNTYKTVILEDLYLQQVLIFMKILEEVGDIYREVQQFKEVVKSVLSRCSVRALRSKQTRILHCFDLLLICLDLN